MRKWFAVAGAMAVFGLMSTASAQSGYLKEVPYVPGQPMPDGAGPDEAWCLYQYPAVVKQIEKEVMVRGEVDIVKPVPAEYSKEVNNYECAPAYSVGTVEPGSVRPVAKPYVCVDAYEMLEIIPPTFKEVTETVELCPAYEEEYWVPAEFTTENQTFTICPERNELQKVACLDGTNMDCYVTRRIQAQTQTVPVKKLVKDGYVAKRPVAAKQGTITRKVVATPADVRRIQIPAVQGQYTCQDPSGAKVRIQQVAAQTFTVTSVKVTKEASTMTEKLPPVMQKVVESVVVEPARIVWRLQRVGVAAPAPVAAVAVDTDTNYDSVPGATFAKSRRIR